MEKQKKKSRHSKQTHNRQYKDRLWRIVEQLFISDWDKRKTNMSNVTAYEKMRRERDDALNQVAEERQKTFMAKKNFREEINKVNKKTNDIWKDL